MVLAVGARFGDRHTGDLAVYRGDRTFIHIDIAPQQIGKVFPADLGIVADAKVALAELARRATPTERPEWTARLATLRETHTRRTDFDESPIKPPRVYQELNEHFDEDTVFVTAIGLYQIWSGQFQRTYKPRHYLCCGQAGPLGWEVPACIGAKLAAPEKQVVGVVGDYSFQFLMEEVAVAVQYRVPFVLVMVNNGYMGLIRQAEQPYDMKTDVDLTWDEGPGIDHVGVMRAMGADGVRVTEAGDIAGALEWACAAAEEQRRAGPGRGDGRARGERGDGQGDRRDRRVRAGAGRRRGGGLSDHSEPWHGSGSTSTARRRPTWCASTATVRSTRSVTSPSRWRSPATWRRSTCAATTAPCSRPTPRRTRSTRSPRSTG